MPAWRVQREGRLMLTYRVVQGTSRGVFRGKDGDIVCFASLWKEQKFGPWPGLRYDFLIVFYFLKHPRKIDEENQGYIFLASRMNF